MPNEIVTDNSKKKYMTIYVTHPNWNTMQEWQTKWLPIYKKKIEYWIAPKGFNVEIKELDYKVKSSLVDM